VLSANRISGRSDGDGRSRIATTSSSRDAAAAPRSRPPPLAGVASPVRVPSQLQLEACFRVVGDQAGKPLVTQRSKVQVAIQLVQTGDVERRRVADIVKVGGGDQMLTVITLERLAHDLRLGGDALHVPPAIPIPLSMSFRLASGALDQAEVMQDVRGVRGRGRVGICLKRPNVSP
jgi:hypothetical protein